MGRWIHDDHLMLITLDTLEAILQLGVTDSVNLYAFEIKNAAGGVNWIADLQRSENIDVQKKAKTILKKYFSKEKNNCK